LPPFRPPSFPRALSSPLPHGGGDDDGAGGGGGSGGGVDGGGGGGGGGVSGGGGERLHVGEVSTQLPGPLEPPGLQCTCFRATREQAPVKSTDVPKIRDLWLEEDVGVFTDRFTARKVEPREARFVTLNLSAK
ncbi:hypothetical protein VaNZ11_006972, partial [Volvox africanus]